MVLLLHLLRLQINQLPWDTGAYIVGAPTSVKDIFEILEDGLGFQSLLRFPVPALFGDLPDSRGNSRGFKTNWLRWSLPLRDHNCDVGVRMVRKRHLPSRKLEGETI